MSQVLYRKYRPKTFGEIEGQEHIVRTLQGALLSGRVGHAYFFCGPRGTGKTTMARLLAKAINCANYQLPITDFQKIPCNSCHSCTEINEGRSLDLVEIDAASNRGIDEIRNLKDSAMVAAPGGKYKVFVVDECLTEDHWVLLSDGTARSISDIKNGDQIVSVDLENGNLMPKLVSNFFARTTEELILIASTQGVIKCTPKHRLWVLRDGVFTLVTADDLRHSDYLISPLTIPHETKNFLKPEQLILLAVIQCDGHISKDSNTIQIEIKKDASYFEEKVREGLKSWGINAQPVITTTRRGTTLIRIYSRELKEKFILLGCPAGKKSRIIDVPAVVFQAPLPSIRAYLDACFCCEGDATWTKSTRLFKLSFTSVSYQFAVKLQLLLKKFGISSSLMSVLRSNKKHATAFRLNLTGYDLRLFQKLIGLSMERKAKTLLGQLSRKLKTDTMPFLTIVRELSRELKISRDFLYACRIFPTQGQNLSRTSFTRFIEISKMAEELNKFLNFRYEKILRVERVQERVKVYDFTVEGTHTFLANGLCSSNCHMLTPPAFNALLKILEEPPVYVVFVLATTEPHKVFDTILSRVQRFDFKKISADRIVEKLKQIARAEKVDIEEPALAALASVASGSLRDAISSLSKLIAYTGLPAGRHGLSVQAGSEKITAEDAAEILGIVPLQVHENLINLIAQKKPQEAIAQISSLFESGIELEHFNRQFVRHLRTLLIARVGYFPAAPARLNFEKQNLGGQASLMGLPTQADITPEFLIKAINLFVKAGAELKFSPIPQLPLELAILELTKPPTP